VSDTPDYSYLANDWVYWSALALLVDAYSSTECDDCEILFASKDYSVHLRRDEDWWVIDTVDDRGQRSDDTAKFSNYDLAEKYLVWMWSSAARSNIRANRLGPKIYSLGMAPNVEAIPIKEGIFELRSAQGRAILAEPYATILSYLLAKDLLEVEEMVRQGFE
jgi:hypothetical protein